MWLLDTMVISELRKRIPDPNVVQWLSSAPEKSLFLSVVTISEIQRGTALQRSKDTPFAERLQYWLDELIRNYADRVLPVTPEIASRWGELTARVGSVIAHEQEIRRNLELEKMLYEQKQQQLNFELEQNRRELLNIIVRFKQLCETYTEIAKKLNDLKTNTNQTGQNQINELIGAIKLNASAFDWNEFQVLFNGIHLNFFSSLQQAHPDLSANERKLCALLKLNMSSKTIATITFHSQAALKKARFRLRKKLNLNDTDSLSSYMQRF